VWRGRKFWVGMDMKVHEIGPASASLVGRGETEAPLGVRMNGNGVANGVGRKNDFTD